MSSAFTSISSDAALLSVEFRIRNPLETVESLSATKPDPDDAPTILGFYDDTPSGGRMANPDARFIWCCHCQKETHWKGYVVESSVGSRFTIGNSCGQDHYGATFDATERNFREKRARQGVLRAFFRLLSKIDGLEEEIEHILSFDGLKDHEKKVRELKQAAPKAYQTLKRAAERGALSAIKKTRNFEAEKERESRYLRSVEQFRSLPSEERRQLRDDGLKPELDDEPIIDLRHEDYGYVTGTSILGFVDPRANALAVRNHLAEFRKIEKRGTDAFASKIITSKRRDLLESSKCLRDSLISMSFAKTFFFDQNLERITGWSECFRGFSLFLLDGDLHAGDDGNQISRIAPLEKETSFATPILDHIHYAGIEDALLAVGAAVLEDPDDPTSKVLV